MLQVLCNCHLHSCDDKVLYVVKYDTSTLTLGKRWDADLALSILCCFPGQGNNKLPKVSDSLERYSTDTLLACEKQVQKLIKLAFAVSAV